MNNDEKRSIYLQGIRTGLRAATQHPEGHRTKYILQCLEERYPVPNTGRELRKEKDSKGTEWKYNPEHRSLYWLDEVGREEYKPVWRGIRAFPKEITPEHILLWAELLKNPYDEDQGYKTLKKLENDVKWILVEVGLGAKEGW